MIAEIFDLNSFYIQLSDSVDDLNNLMDHLQFVQIDFIYLFLIT